MFFQSFMKGLKGLDSTSFFSVRFNLMLLFSKILPPDDESCVMMHSWYLLTLHEKPKTMKRWNQDETVHGFIVLLV